MLGAAIKALLFVMVVICATLFLLWNQQAVTVTLIPGPVQFLLWTIPGESVTGVPIGNLALVGVVVGIVLTAIFAWGGWARQRMASISAQARVSRAKEKLSALQGLLNAQEAELRALRAGQVVPVTIGPAAASVGTEFDLDDEMYAGP